MAKRRIFLHYKKNLSSKGDESTLKKSFVTLEKVISDTFGHYKKEELSYMIKKDTN